MKQMMIFISPHSGSMYTKCFLELLKFSFANITDKNFEENVTGYVTFIFLSKLRQETFSDAYFWHF